MSEILVLWMRKLVSRIRKSLKMIECKKRITKNFKDLDHRRKLTKEQKKEVQDFYVSMIGKKIPLYCHEYFYSRTGVFTKEYVPNNIYHCELVPKANNHRYGVLAGDKNLCDLMFPGENVVHSILKNMNGYYYFEGRPVSEEEAVSLCQNLENVIIKPTQATQGHGVQVFSSKNGMTDLNGKSVQQFLRDTKKIS